MSQYLSTGSRQPPSTEESLARIARESDDAAWSLRGIRLHTRGSLINRSLMLALTLVAMDCLLVAHYQASVALAVARWTPPVTLFAGVLINLSPIVVPALIIVIAARTVVLLAQGESARGISALAWVLLLVAVGLTFVPRQTMFPLWIYPMPFLVLLAVEAARHKEFSGLQRLIAAGVALVLSIVGISGVVTTVNSGWGTDGSHLQRALARPFAAPEALQWRGTDAPTVGYVLQVDGGWVVVLEESPRQILVRPASDLIARHVCSLGSPSEGGPFLPLVPVQESPPCP